LKFHDLKKEKEKLEKVKLGWTSSVITTINFVPIITLVEIITKIFPKFVKKIDLYNV